MKKYRDLYEVEKQQYEEALQGYQEDHMNEVEIISLRKRCNKTAAKAETKRGAVTKADSKTGAKAASKAPRSRYHLCLREQLEKMTGEDRRHHRSIVSGRWKEIKEDPARLSAYNDRARQMKNEGERLGNDSQHEKTVAERPAVKQPQKAPKTPEFVDTDSDTEDEQEPAVKQPPRAPKTPASVDTDSDTEDKEEQEPAVKQPRKVPKSSGPVRMESDVSDHDKPMVKKIQTLPKKATPGNEPILPEVKQSPELIETDPEDSYLEITLRDIAFDSIGVSVEGTYRGKKISHVGTCDNSDLCKMMVSPKVDKQIKETIGEFLNQRQPPEWFEDDLDNEEEEPHPQKTSPGPVDKELTQPVETPTAVSRTPVTSYTYILTSVLRRAKQCKLKASDETGKFCHLDKR